MSAIVLPSPARWLPLLAAATFAVTTPVGTAAQTLGTLQIVQEHGGGHGGGGHTDGGHTDSHHTEGGHEAGGHDTEGDHQGRGPHGKGGSRGPGHIQNGGPSPGHTVEDRVFHRPGSDVEEFGHTDHVGGEDHEGHDESAPVEQPG